MNHDIEKMQKAVNEMKARVEKMSVLEAKGRMYDLKEEQQAIVQSRQAELTAIAGEEKMLKDKINLV